MNELVSNAYKYAFDNQEKGKVEIGIRSLDDSNYELNVKDNVKELDDDFEPKKSKSLGLMIVKMLSKQLSSTSSNGANFTVLFKDLRTLRN